MNEKQKSIKHYLNKEAIKNIEYIISKLHSMTKEEKDILNTIETCQLSWPFEKTIILSHDEYNKLNLDLIEELSTAYIIFDKQSEKGKIYIKTNLLQSSFVSVAKYSDNETINYLKITFPSHLTNCDLTKQEISFKGIFDE